MFLYYIKTIKNFFISQKFFTKDLCKHKTIENTFKNPKNKL